MQRRDFIGRAAMAAGLTTIFPASIQKALAIDPESGTTFLDAEHVVILMQENRSFDHCFGSLRGVRGFNDPRAITQPNANPVWLQTNAAGETYAPFRLDIKDTRATWMGSLPHSWTNQVDARNGGNMDRWLDAKKSDHEAFANMPLTMGYYDRNDLPFYYSMADAFTICDQNFCSSLTGTTPNRLYLWSGTIRGTQDEHAQARVLNEEADAFTEVSWKTFPERLEENGISWKVYQNEITADVGFSGEEEPWLANFGDNPLEFFSQYQVRFHPAYIRNLPAKTAALSSEIKELTEKLKATSGQARERLSKTLHDKQQALSVAEKEITRFTKSNFNNLSQREKNLHEKAFVTNDGDPGYHSLDAFSFTDNGVKKEMKVPKGDVLFQFRKDVMSGTLPTVSWLVAPENLSDHPSAPWYGAAYISETIDILTHDPEVWKKTIFILAYDENDGYFDHVPPFSPPHPNKPETGKVSEGVDTRVDYVTFDEDKKWRGTQNPKESPIGLGFRVPLVIASPWSRGGVVNSQLCDHTSVLQFLEKFLTSRTGKKIEETNISPWRRLACGDLTSAFRPYNGEQIPLPEFVIKNDFYGLVRKAKEKGLPGNFRKFSDDEIKAIRKDPANAAFMPRQEKGTRASNALPYELYADGQLAPDRKSFLLIMRSGNAAWKDKAAGAPFLVYSDGHLKRKGATSYGVQAGKEVSDAWVLNEFENNRYHLKLHGPNGFYREFRGDSKDLPVSVHGGYEDGATGPTGNFALTVTNNAHEPLEVRISDLSYHAQIINLKISANDTSTHIINLSKSFNWYDLQVEVPQNPGFVRRLAGRIETGRDGVSDPAMA